MSIRLCDHKVVVQTFGNVRTSYALGLRFDLVPAKPLQPHSPFNLPESSHVTSSPTQTLIIEPGWGSIVGLKYLELCQTLNLLGVATRVRLVWRPLWGTQSLLSAVVTRAPRWHGGGGMPNFSRLTSDTVFSRFVLSVVYCPPQILRTLTSHRIPGTKTQKIAFSRTLPMSASSWASI